MNQNKLYLFASIIWLGITGGFIVALFADFYYGYTPEWLTALHVPAAGSALSAAVVNLNRYKKGITTGKRQEQE